LRYSFPFVFGIIGGHFEYSNYYNANSASCLLHFITSVFLDPYNVQINSKIIIFWRLAVFRKKNGKNHGSHFVKSNMAAMDVAANGNIVFLNACTISFPKMYSFQNLHKNPTKLKIMT